MKPNGWKRLFRTDLKTFDDRATELVLAAMDRGAMGRISSKGHAILRGPDGQTMSVSRNTGSGNRGRQNMEAEFVRIFGPLEVRALPRAVGDSVSIEHPLVPTRETVMIACPLDSCDAEFVTEGARYTHVQREHFPCKEPGCQRVFDNATKASGHFNVTHGRKVWQDEPAECKDCDWTGTRAGLGGHRAQAHGNGNRRVKAKPEAKPEVPQKSASSDSAPPVQAKAPSKDSFRLAMEALAQAHDEALARAKADRVHELEARVSELEAKNSELEARLALLKEALNA